jgi:hypothetical protein
MTDMQRGLKSSKTADNGIEISFSCQVSPLHPHRNVAPFNSCENGTGCGCNPSLARYTGRLSVTRIT